MVTATLYVNPSHPDAWKVCAARELLGLQSQVAVEASAAALAKALASKALSKNVLAPPSVNRGLGGSAPDTLGALLHAEGAANDGAGLALFRSNAIVRFLLATARGSAILDPADQASFDLWCEVEESEVGLGARQLVHELGNCARKATAYKSVNKSLTSALAKIDTALANTPFLAGDELTIADILVFPWIKLVEDYVEEEKRAAIVAWLRAVSASKPVQTAMGATMNVISVDELATQISDLGISEPKLPKPGMRNVLITSALPYVNNVPHLGNLIGCVLSADVYARFCRNRGYNVLYVCGTDEYGTATQTKALEEKLTCRQICDKYHAIHKDIYDWFDISFDQFGRTSTPTQTYICQSIYQAISDNDMLIEESMQQLYCEPIGFLADRLVEGTCPKCKYEDARGDQCDNCGSLLNPTELINPRCKVGNGVPEIRDTNHLFLDLPRLEPKLREYVTTTSKQGGWSSNCVQVTMAWLRDGLKKRCITRDLKWGTPVPREGFEDKVFYVWFDAPIGYISITAAHTPEWQKWWKNPKEVELVQFMGKDNVPFHTVIFPSTLIGTGEEWTMMKSISVTEYLNYEGGKFSKSRSTGVFGNDAKSTRIAKEVWRYYLLANRPEQADAMFMWNDLKEKNNAELLANLGNFINRVLSFCAARLEGVIPSVPADAAVGIALGEKVGPLVRDYVTQMDKIKIKDGLKQLMAISRIGNGFLQEHAPWDLLKQGKAEECKAVIAAGAGVVYILLTLMEPFMPSLADKILTQMNMTRKDMLTLVDSDLEKCSKPHLLVSARTIGKPEPLFRKLLDEEIDEYRARFGGASSDDTSAPAAAPANNAKKLDKSGKPVGGKPKSGGGTKVPEGPVDVARLNVKVGKVVKAWKHPDADSLYVEEIDVGEEKPRQIVSGLVKFIPLEEFEGSRVCVLANIKPTKMRGVESQGMVLAAENSDHSVVQLVTPPEGAPLGERVLCEGYTGDPDEQLNPRKKVWEAVQADLLTNDKCEATYKGIVFSTSAGPCRVRDIMGGTIR